MNIFPVIFPDFSDLNRHIFACLYKTVGIVLKILRDMHFAIAPSNDLSTFNDSVSHAVGCTFLAYQTFFFLVLQLQCFFVTKYYRFSAFQKK